VIKIDCMPPDDPEWGDWRVRCDAAKNKAINDYRGSGRVVINSTLYGEMKNKYFLSETGPFQGKCAYCEQKIISDQHGDIDHYRPKLKVTDENDQVITVTIDGEEKAHPGYYWLAYEWTNMLPSCILCNQPSKGRKRDESLGKRNRFPVRGQYAVIPGEEEHENALLLNPTIDDPADHFSFQINGILALDSPRAEVTEKILGLNSRSLVEDRKEKYDLIKAKSIGVMTDIINARPNLNDLEYLKKIYAGSSAFTVASRVAINEIDKTVNGALKDIIALN